MCGDPKSLMPPGSSRRVRSTTARSQEIIAWITASRDTEFVYQPAVPEGQVNVTPPPAVTVHGWRDPAYTPLRCDAGAGMLERTVGNQRPGRDAQPIASPGTADNPRVIEIQATDQIRFVDPQTGEQLTSAQRSSRARPSSSTSSTTVRCRTTSTLALPPICRAQQSTTTYPASTLQPGDADLHLHVRQPARSAPVRVHRARSLLDHARRHPHRGGAAGVAGSVAGLVVTAPSPAPSAAP